MWFLFFSPFYNLSRECRIVFYRPQWAVLPCVCALKIHSHSPLPQLFLVLSPYLAVCLSDTPVSSISTNPCLKRERPRRCTSCVSWEKNGAGERREFCTFFQGDFTQEFISSVEGREKDQSSGQNLVWFMRDLSVQEQRLRGQDRTKEEGKDKCQSVETCLGIWGRRGGGERQRGSKSEKQRAQA